MRIIAGFSNPAHCRIEYIELINWIEIEEAKENIEEYFKRNGIPQGAISNVTPISEYK